MKKDVSRLRRKRESVPSATVWHSWIESVHGLAAQLHYDFESGKNFDCATIYNGKPQSEIGQTDNIRSACRRQIPIV